MEAYFVENLRTVYIFGEGQLNEVKVVALHLQYKDGVLSNCWFKCETDKGTKYMQKEECYLNAEAYKKGKCISLSSIHWESLFKNKGTTFWYLNKDGDVCSKDISKGYVTVILTPNEYGRFVNFRIYEIPDTNDLYARREDVFLYHDVKIKNMDGTIKIHENPFDKAKLTEKQQAKVREMLDVYRQLEALGVELMINYDGQVFAINANNGAEFDSCNDNERYYHLDCSKFLAGETSIIIRDNYDTDVMLEKQF